MPHYDYNDIGHETTYSREEWVQLSEFEQRAEFSRLEYDVHDLPLDPSRNYLIWHDEYALYPYLNGQPISAAQWRTLCTVSTERVSDRLAFMGCNVEVTSELLEAARRHRGSKYDTEGFPHGTRKGYWYGCTRKDECPASPTCWAQGRSYRTDWKSARQALLQKERREWLLQQIAEIEQQIEIRNSFSTTTDDFAQMRHDRLQEARAASLEQLQTDVADALQRGDVAASQRLTEAWQTEDAVAVAEIDAFVATATTHQADQEERLTKLKGEVAALNAV